MMALRASLPVQWTRHPPKELILELTCFRLSIRHKVECLPRYLPNHQAALSFQERR